MRKETKEALKSFDRAARSFPFMDVAKVYMPSQQDVDEYEAAYKELIRQIRKEKK